MFLQKIHNNEIALTNKDDFLGQLQISINFEEKWVVIFNYLDAIELNSTPKHPYIEDDRAYIKIERRSIRGNLTDTYSTYVYVVDNSISEVFV